MGVFSPIVQIAVLAVLPTGSDVPLRGTVAGELVGDTHPRHVHEPLEQLADELLGGFLVPAAVDQNIQDVAILIDGQPEVVPCPIAGAADFIEMTLVSGFGTPAPELIGILRPNRAAPLADGFAGHHHPTCTEPRFDVVGTQAEAEVPPDPMADHLGREAVVLVAVGR